MIAKRTAKTQSFSSLIGDLANNGRIAQRALGSMSSQKRTNALLRVAASIRARCFEILEANQQDIENGTDRGLNDAMLDRLRLDENRITAMAASVEAVANLPDPLGAVIDESTQPNGLQMRRVRVPIGVVGIIYESRPNVTADAASLCVRSGNAVLLRGGSEAEFSNKAIYAALKGGLLDAEMPPDLVQIMPTQDRLAVGEMLKAAGKIDLIVPRGGKGLVARVQNDARVPVLAHLDGICHTYVHATADPNMALEIVLNAKMRRPGICGATETLLIDKHFTAISELVRGLLEADCEVRGDESIQKLDKRILQAVPADWDTEYLAPIVSVASVESFDQAIAHISRHSSGHTEAIVCEDRSIAEQFLNEVDSAIVMHNTSTQFADGGEFGLGAEIGIATGRLHARGPVALEGLTTYKWQVRGHGQVRSV